MENAYRDNADQDGSTGDGADKLTFTEQPSSGLSIAPVILAGGSGTRLWPLSRENHPKQLIDVIGTQSLLQDTVSRMQGFSAQWTVRSAPIIICGEEHRFVTAEQLRENGVEAQLIVEPARRDTAPT
jgi:mannose-1-phosphate guanylyltransferase/mannose-6-phosphate isomerase